MIKRVIFYTLLFGYSIAKTSGGMRRRFKTASTVVKGVQIMNRIRKEDAVAIGQIRFLPALWNFLVCCISLPVFLINGFFNGLVEGEIIGLPIFIVGFVYALLEIALKTVRWLLWSPQQVQAVTNAGSVPVSPTLDD